MCSRSRSRTAAVFNPRSLVDFLVVCDMLQRRFDARVAADHVCARELSGLG